MCLCAFASESCYASVAEHPPFESLYTILNEEAKEIFRPLSDNRRVDAKS